MDYHKLNFKMKRLIDRLRKKEIYSYEEDQATNDRLKELERMGFVQSRGGSWSGEPVYGLKEINEK